MIGYLQIVCAYARAAGVKKLCNYFPHHEYDKELSTHEKLLDLLRSVHEFVTLVAPGKDILVAFHVHLLNGDTWRGRQTQ